MQNDVIKRIEDVLQSNKLVIFMKGTPDAPRCGFSAASVEVLRKFPYPLKGVDVLADPEIRATLPDYSQWPTFPQIFVDGKLIGGCDILHEMRDSGDLEKVLAEAFKK